MSKEKINLKVTSDGGEVKISINDEKRARIPRVGDMMFCIQKYPVDDEDEDSRDRIKEDAIAGYSYSKKLVAATALNDEGDTVTINGDFTMSLDDDMKIRSNNSANNGLIVFQSEDDAFEKYKSLMNASINEAKTRIEKYEKTMKYLEEALEEVHH